MLDTARLFIALPLPATLRQQLHDTALALQKTQGGRVMRAENLHMTLAFLGETPRTEIPALLKLLASWPAPPGELQLDVLGSFSRGGIVWAGSRAIPVCFCEWAANRRSDLLRHPIHFDTQPFKPHITLLRDARPCTNNLLPLHWAPEAAMLFASENTAHGLTYRPLTQG